MVTQFFPGDVFLFRKVTVKGFIFHWYIVSMNLPFINRMLKVISAVTLLLTLCFLGVLVYLLAVGEIPLAIVSLLASCFCGGAYWSVTSKKGPQ